MTSNSGSVMVVPESRASINQFAERCVPNLDHLDCCPHGSLREEFAAVLQWKTFGRVSSLIYVQNRLRHLSWNANATFDSSSTTDTQLASWSSTQRHRILKMTWYFQTHIHKTRFYRHKQLWWKSFVQEEMQYVVSSAKEEVSICLLHYFILVLAEQHRTFCVNFH